MAKSFPVPDHYILLCAGRYAATLADHQKADASERQRLQQRLEYLLESGKLEAKLERRRRKHQIASDLWTSVRDRAPLQREISNAEAEAIRHYYAIPPIPLVDDLSGVELLSLGELFAGWAQEPCRHDPRTMIELLGWSDGMRTLAHAVGETYEPPPPARGAAMPILKFLATKKPDRTDSNNPEPDDSTSDLPLMTHLTEEPSRLDPLASWEQHLTDLRALPDSIARRLSIQRAEEIVSERRRQRDV